MEFQRLQIFIKILLMNQKVMGDQSHPSRLKPIKNYKKLSQMLKKKSLNTDSINPNPKKVIDQFKKLSKDTSKNGEDILIEKLEKQFDGADLRQTLRSNETISREINEYLNREKYYPNKVKSKPKIAALWDKYMAQINQDQIKNKIQKQRLETDQRILVDIVWHANQGINRIQQHYYNCLLKIYQDKNVPQFQRPNLEHQLQSIQQALNNQYLQVKFLLIGMLKNGCYYSDGQATVLGFMAYHQHRLNKQKKQQQQIINGTKTGMRHLKEGKQCTSKKEQINWKYIKQEGINFVPTQNDFAEILDEMSRRYLIGLYQELLKNMQNKELPNSSPRQQINKFSVINLLNLKGHQQQLKKKKKTTDHNIRAEARLAIRQYQNPNQDCPYNPEQFSVRNYDNNPLKIHQSSPGNSYLRHNYLYKKDINDTYEKIKKTALPQLLNISKLRTQQQTNILKSNTVQISNKKLNQSAHILENELIGKAQTSNRYSIKEIQSIDKPYRKRISLPIINSQIKIRPRKSKYLRNSTTIHEYLSTRNQEHPMPKIDNKASKQEIEKRRIRNAYPKQQFQSVYRILFGIPSYF